ncbi:unnamed protein product [Lactuca virosa]|uniref:Uncharacterized protein n=1 Tax=Lactuca virosa TaxID=75947 RepID=A0AAU9LGP6_9ASTR|nr:unnamed protein product [Lactuca virosa]
MWKELFPPIEGIREGRKLNKLMKSKGEEKDSPLATGTALLTLHNHFHTHTHSRKRASKCVEFCLIPVEIWKTFEVSRYLTREKSREKAIFSVDFGIETW